MYAKTEAAARRKLREMVTRKEAGETVMDAAVTVRRFSSEWLDNDAERTRAPSTVKEYRRRLESYVVPVIGNVPLRSLTTIHVERLLQGMAEAGLGKSSIAGCRNALSAMLNDAVSARRLRANPAVNVKLPIIDGQRKSPSVTPDQALRLLEVAANSDLAELLLFVAHTGCRIGEALGARWIDVDLDRGEWLVCRTTTLNAEGRVVARDRTKTGEPRIAYLQPPAVQALQAQRAKVAAARLKAGQYWQDSDLVFPSSVGTPQDSRNLRKELRKFAALAGYQGSFHQLRHLFATVAASKVTLTSLSKVLGHRRTATTADLYAHLYDRDAVDASAAVASVLDGRNETQQ